MTHDTTVAGARKRISELGYAWSSATAPERILTPWQHGGNRACAGELAAHEACILCYPSRDGGAPLAEGDDGSGRQVVDLVVTAYLQSDPRQFKAIMAVLERYGLTSGPYYSDGFGDRHYILQSHGEPIYDRHQTRLCFESDDRAVALRQAIEPRYTLARNQVGGAAQVAATPIGTHVVPVGVEWKQGHILDTPHRKLPELLQVDIGRFIDDCELARWGARPLAKEAAA